MHANTQLPEHSPAPAPALDPSNLTVPSETPYLDANGYDPAAYQWVPVLRKPRSDGWSEAKQRDFIEALADGGSVAEAARAVHMSASSAYRLRRSPGGEAFARAWDAAVAQAVGMLVDVAFDRAINGTVEPVLDADGRRVGSKHRPGDRMLMFLLAAHYPDRYGKQQRRRPAPGEAEAPPPASAQSVAAALDALSPVTPAEPEKLMSPADLDVAIQVADLSDGRLPGWLDPDRRIKPVARKRVEPPLHDALAAALAAQDDIYIGEPGPLGEAFEVELELAKRGIVVPRPKPNRRARRAQRRV
ncbi:MULTISPECIES: hypothetical protein [Sphingomonas]|jgi:hypothetical protein|uniref:Uncharacterized protein n=1 Tax=Sphingomonas hankookensis TaxID=563996 RepID=A0ABR5YA59_9SPHN|nr:MULTISPECIES: hypothetical protein [Sphingomonas]KZE11603.1 hypothetical protein AVT10_05020 [Sphingomonas hankookensis]PZT94012.1 MAG: hypothetical protein DI625_07625 [Sphingomonas sp.]WCP72345.1 hypothetical protein PPZ50_01920 [Sphingomonas hankookensis]